MKQWLSRMKLAHKMVLGFLGLIALPFTLLSVFSFASVASHYEHQLAQDGQYMLNMVVSDVNEKMDHVEMLMQVLSCNQNLIAFLSHDYNGAVSHEEYTQTVMPLLQGASNAVSPPLERVYLLTKNTTIPEGYSAVYHYDSVPKSIPTELLENGREATWYHAEIDGKDVLYYLCPIVSSVYKNEGYLLAKMQVDELFPEFGMPQQNGVALFLLDEENRPKLSNVTLNSDFRFPQTAGSQESVRCFSTEIQRVPLRVGVALPVSEHGYLQQSSLLILIFVGFLSLLFLSLFFSMIRSINSRLQRYGDEMERIAESGFNGELAVERQDEIGVIGNQFNRVLGRMRVLMQENIQKETAYKDAQLKALLLQINPHFSRFASLNEMQEYLQKVLKQMEAAVQTATNKYAHILSIAKQYVQNNYNRDISMDEVAEMVSMSYSYFSRVFKEQLHQSFSEYVLSVRMREAKRLMEEDPAIKIKEVAELVGYESVYTFSRAYKQYYHVSPKQDRDG